MCSWFVSRNVSSLKLHVMHLITTQRTNWWYKPNCCCLADIDAMKADGRSEESASTEVLSPLQVIDVPLSGLFCTLAHFVYYSFLCKKCLPRPHFVTCTFSRYSSKAFVITDLVIEVYLQLAPDCGVTFHPDYGSRICPFWHFDSTSRLRCLIKAHQGLNFHVFCAV